VQCSAEVQSREENYLRAGVKQTLNFAEEEEEGVAVGVEW